MKTNLKHSALVLSIIFTAAAAMAQGQDLVGSLKQDELKSAPNGAILPASANDKVLRSLSIGVPPSSEGIPGQESEPSASDLLNTRYNTSTLIRRALVDAQRKPVGPRIQFYEQKAAQIIKNSGQLPDEQATRIVLNRAIDVVQTTLKSAGNNSELIANIVAQFYKNSFEIALAYVNNPPNSMEGFFPRAEVGIYFARFLWSNQAGLTSDSLKAITLIKLLGYLGQDLNSDLQRRKTLYREALVDIYDIQNNETAYSNIMDSLKNQQEPRSSDVAGLRVRVNNMLELLSPAR